MSLNTDLAIERADLEIAIEELLTELGVSDLEDFGGHMSSLPLAELELVRRVEALQCRLEELDDLQRRYNRHLGEIADG